jgi:hypothetical protein
MYPHALEDASDKVRVRLSKGWNDLLLRGHTKQSGMEFCAKVIKAGRSHLEGLMGRDGAESTLSCRP